MSEYLMQAKAVVSKNMRTIFIIGMSIAILAACWYFYMYKPSVGSIMASAMSSSAGVSQDLVKSLGLVVFYNPSDPASAKQLDLIKDYLGSMHHVDTTTEEGAGIAKKYNIDTSKVVFLAPKYELGLNSSEEGYTMGEIMQKFESLKKTHKPSVPSQQQQEQQEQQPDSEDISGEALKDLDIILVTMEGCGHCTKAKEMWKDSGFVDLIRIIPLESEPGQKLAKEYTLNKGFPAYVSVKSGKTAVGTLPINALIKKLSA